MCFFDKEKVLHRVSKTLITWELNNELWWKNRYDSKAVTRLYKEVEIKFQIGSELGKKYAVEIGVHQGTVISMILFTIVIVAATDTLQEKD